MKKLLGVFFIIFSVGGFVLADDLAYVSVEYCNTPDNVLQYQIDPLAETGICYTLSNGSKVPVTIKLSFVDGIFTNDQRQNKACLSETDTENFGKYVTEYDELVSLNPGETIKKEAKLMYPKDMDGLYYGCLVYSVVEQKEVGVGTSFSILMRKAKFIDVIVGDPLNAKERGIVLEEFTHEDGENISHNPKIRVYQDSSDGKYIMQIKVKNISRTQQNIMITGAVASMLGHKNIFEEGRKILKGESLLISKKFDTMPVYNLNIHLNITNTPMTFGNIKPMLGQIKEKTIIWIFDTIMFITLVGILMFAGIIVLLIKDIKRRKSTTVKADRENTSETKKVVTKKHIVEKKSIKNTHKKK